MLSYRYIALASLVSAFAWIDASINRRIQGSGYHKAYLHDQRDAVLAHPDMVAPPSTPGGWYHTQKNVLTVFLETAQIVGGEEMSSKYLSFVSVSAGFITCLVMVIIAAVIWVIAW